MKRPSKKVTPKEKLLLDETHFLFNSAKKFELEKFMEAPFRWVYLNRGNALMCECLKLVHRLELLRNTVNSRGLPGVDRNIKFVDKSYLKCIGAMKFHLGISSGSKDQADVALYGDAQLWYGVALGKFNLDDQGIIEVMKLGKKFHKPKNLLRNEHIKDLLTKYPNAIDKTRFGYADKKIIGDISQHRFESYCSEVKKMMRNGDL